MGKKWFAITLLLIWAICIYIMIFKLNINGMIVGIMSYAAGILIKKLTNLKYREKDVKV